MTKIKIAAVIACMLATGVFAGFTYQAANNSEKTDKVTVSTVSDDEEEDELVTDEETTDAEVTDEETTAEEVTAEETAPEVKKNEKKDTKKEKKAKKAVKKEEAAEQEEEPVVTTAPVVEYVPETIAEYEQYAEVYEEQFVEYTEPEYSYEYEETKPVVEEEPAEVTEETEVSKEAVTEAPEAEETEESEQEEGGRKIEVTDAEYIWLCNVVAHEYGSDWISEYEKAKVVEVVMNRVNDSRFPDSIWGVLTQPYQFSGLEWTLHLGTYSYQVTDSVKAAVDLYLEHPEQFQHGYLGFWGDGRSNHFYSV